ncbi:Ubiquitin-like modifier-activating enzyme ATG7, partial [Geodia barretti]
LLLLLSLPPSTFLPFPQKDLKKYNFHYWFVFPALFPNDPLTTLSIKTIGSVWNDQQLQSLQKAYDSFRSAHPGIGFFIVVMTDDGTAALHELREAETCLSTEKFMLGFCDPSTMETNPGWPLRNLLILAAQKWSDRLNVVDVLCYRDYTRDGRRLVSHSLLLEGVKLPDKMSTDVLPKVTGWEKNDKNKSVPKMVNLSSSMDPVRLAESSVDLNLKLMRWRLIPSLDLEAVSSTKCLLLGAGTLGCNVARCLMGWGVRHITLLDNSTVSYSNPVRQSLFTFHDCSSGGKHKAKAAVESMRLIFPGVKAEAVDSSIPMPGHSVGTNAEAIQKARKDVETVEKLVQTHDVVFLLMDTRESRWLPTLLTSAHSKICINAALGFDTYMVMRHGFRPQPGTETGSPGVIVGGCGSGIPGDQLGCYFCSDVVAPTDSTRDRTLDQQCTVSRPGISMVAGALATELLVSLLQHPLKALAPSDSHTEDDSESESCLGLIPHQIRGFMSRFQNVLPASQAFDKCTACSPVVLSRYREEGFDFLLKAFNTPNFLEDLTGLSQLYAETDDDQVWELSDGEDDM